LFVRANWAGSSGDGVRPRSLTRLSAAVRPLTCSLEAMARTLVMYCAGAGRARSMRRTKRGMCGLREGWVRAAAGW
jgi:hypothetical protein